MEIRRTKIYVPTPTPVNYLAKYLRWFGIFVLCMVLYAVIIVAIFEFMAGCGETTYYADRTWTTNECIFIPYTPTSGTW
jgi:hypothetical protein